jgi:peptidoglycan/LPS O-acetylase OafA/YrhL
MEKKYYAGLDGLRGIAVAIVVLAHAGFPLFRSGGVGVDIFFVLSGFLITSILLSEFDRFGRVSIINFYMRRFLRLLPCLLITVAAFCLVGVYFNIERAVENSVLSVTYLMNWARAFRYTGGGALGHTWSLACEEQYYLVWPFLVVAMCRSGISRSWMGCFMLILAVCLAVYRFWMSGFCSDQRIYFGLDTHSDGLVLGGALACFVSLPKGERLSKKFSLLVSGLFAPLCFATILGVAQFSTWKELWMAQFGIALVSICTFIIVLDIVSSSYSILRWILSFNLFIWIGKLSYGIYLIHFPIFSVVTSFDFIWGWQRILMTGGVLTILAAWLSYSFVESHFLALKDKHFGIRNLKAAASGAVTMAEGGGV